MHFSIPETEEITGSNSTSFTVFKLHVNGVYHCSVRYSQLHDFQFQLHKEFPGTILPSFPPKKLFPLTSTQLEERRNELERFIQHENPKIFFIRPFKLFLNAKCEGSSLWNQSYSISVSQIPHIANSSAFNGFLLTAQQASQHEVCEDVKLDVFLANGYKITVDIKSTEQTEEVLEAVASKIELRDQYVYYFGLYLIRNESGVDFSIVRKLQDFESPFISTKSANAAVGSDGRFRIMLRKAYWDITMDDDLMEDRVAMNLLYVQAVDDVERCWMVANEEHATRLATLQQRGSKKEYLRLARTLRYYGYTMFKACTTDYPHPDTPVQVAAGNKELNLRIQLKPNEEKEVGFKVTRMRCWRISSMVADSAEERTRQVSSPAGFRLELAFEYLVAKNTLKWITIFSSQAILISMCLQGMVDELIMKKDGRKLKRAQDRHKVCRNLSSESGHAQQHSQSSPSVEKVASAARTPNKQLSTSRFASVSGVTENDAFDGIQDDDL